ncbi:MAG: aminoglycoside 3'-phosphotransferase [Ruminococcaceae bacterium]|nr:aminoglycoside 3'-phosphotransferase [Oscillospiraceae bacterium]
MKRTLIDSLPLALPHEFDKFIVGAKIFDSSCSPEARVYYIESDGGYYLKTAPKGTLLREAQMTEYFHSIGLGAEILGYCSGDVDLLLTSRMRGEDCTHADYLADGKRLCDTIATELRRLHELDFSDCPVQDRISEYITTVEANYRTGNYDTSHFPDSFGYTSAEDAMLVFKDGSSRLRRDVLLHGDYCLPNIMLDNWRLSGFIDLGNGGVGDRHIDIFWGVWTLGFNLRTDAYRDRFLDAYGRDKVDEEMLRIVAAAEVFG